MNRTSLLVASTALTLLLAPASRSFALFPCSECSCYSSACSETCSGGPGTCGATGLCSGGFNCGGGGCLTAGDLAALQPEAKPTTQADPFRGRVAARLTWRLAQHVEESGLGEVYTAETGLLIGARGLMQAPDLAFVRHERLGLPGAPDLAIEIRSIEEPAAGIAAKVRTWLAAGARTVLVIDPAAQTIAVHRSQAGVKLLRADDLLEVPSLLPGWSVRVGDLFED